MAKIIAEISGKLIEFETEVYGIGLWDKTTRLDLEPLIFVSIFSGYIEINGITYDVFTSVYKNTSEEVSEDELKNAIWRI